jgi:hypothetical protein
MVARSLVVLAFQAASAYSACTCTPASLESAKSLAKAIFRGTISEIRDLGADYPSLNNVYFDVTRVLKGQVGPVYGMPLHEQTSGCVGLPASFLKVGSDLLVYVEMTPEGVVYTSTCSRTALAKGNKDLDELGQSYDLNVSEQPVLVEPTRPSVEKPPTPNRAGNRNLPDGSALFSRYLDTTKDYSPASTLTIVGELSVKTPPLHGSLLIHQDISGRMYSVIDLPPIGKLERGFDGAVAWDRTPFGGVQIVPKQDFRRTIFGLSPDDVKNWNTRFKVETIGEDAVDGQPCYLVRMTPRAAGTPATACLDEATGLMVKLTNTVHIHSGDMVSTQFMRDYRDEGGVLLAHQYELTIAELPMVIELTEIRRDVELSSHVFDLPDDVRALVEAVQRKNSAK